MSNRPATPSWRERQYVPTWWWLVGGALFGSVTVAIGVYLGPWPGLALTVLALGSMAWLLTAWGRTEVEVRPDGLRVGRSVLEWEYAGEPAVLTGDEHRRRLGRDADARGWLATPPWLSESVEVPVRDAADHHPYWLVGSRDAAGLAAAIREAATATPAQREHSGATGS